MHAFISTNRHPSAVFVMRLSQIFPIKSTSRKTADRNNIFFGNYLKSNKNNHMTRHRTHHTRKNIYIMIKFPKFSTYSFFLVKLLFFRLFAFLLHACRIEQILTRTAIKAFTTSAFIQTQPILCILFLSPPLTALRSISVLPIPSLHFAFLLFLPPYRRALLPPVNARRICRQTPHASPGLTSLPVPSLRTRHHDIFYRYFRTCSYSCPFPRRSR